MKIIQKTQHIVYITADVFFKSDYIYLHVYKPIQAHMDLVTYKLKLHLNNFFQLLSHLLMKLNQKSSMFLLSSTPTCECLCGALSTMITFCLHVNNLCLCTFSLPNVNPLQMVRVDPC